MPATTLGTSGLVFGTADEGIGLVQSFTETRNAEKVEVKNEAGDVEALAFVNATTSYSFSVAVTGNFKNIPGVALASLANAATFTAGKVIVDSVTVNKSNDAFASVDISATGYPNLG
jgi:hypothetical protein